MIIRQIPTSELPKFLASNGGIFRSGVRSMGERVSVEDVAELLASGHMQLWAAIDEGDDVAEAIVLSEVVTFPRMKVLRLFGLAGSKIREVAKLLPAIKAWGREQGCAELEAVETRPGLEVIIPDFQKTGVCLVMSLKLNSEAA